MASKRGKMNIAAATAAAQQAASTRAHRALPKGTVGSVRSAVSGIQEIDTDSILPWGPQDRLSLELTAVNSEGDLHSLAESIQKNGQQVPVLLRPSAEHDGKFEVIYGRRRIQACREIGLKVKALIRTMDDTEALIAKGLENSSRQNLSFYERCRFAKEIADQGHDNNTIMQALAISKNTLSQLNRITRNVPEEIGVLIGTAPKSGRSRWEILANAFQEGRADTDALTAMLKELPPETLSDERLESAIAFCMPKATPEAAKRLRVAKGVTLKADEKTLTISVRRAGGDEVFASWLERNIEELIKKAHDEAS